jgi:N-acetylglucosaminyl-diphospho-decaprenol L-rhamnosyltransferase
MPVSLDVVIVNWNSGPHLRRCLDSMQHASRKGLEFTRIVVVDNASSDGSADHPDFTTLPVGMIQNNSNRGFAAACNQGAQGSKADYLLFLNPDTVLQENSLEAPITFLNCPENTHIGICGIQLTDEAGRVSRSCARFPTAGHLVGRALCLDRLFPRFFPNHFLCEWDHCESRVVDQVMGSFFLVRRAVFDLLGGLDEGFFVYYEDLDFSYRARQAGWSSYFLATARAVHRGGVCSGQAKAARLCYSLQSRILYGYKHFGRAVAAAILIGTVLVEPFSRLAWAGWRGSAREVRETLQGYAILWRSLPLLLVKESRRHRNGSASPGALRSGISE